MKSQVVKRSVVIDGHKTSISLEDAFWSSLKEIAHAERATVSELVAKIDKTRKQGNLSSAVRLFVLDRVRWRGARWGDQRISYSTLAKSRHRAPHGSFMLRAIFFGHSAVSSSSQSMSFGQWTYSTSSLPIRSEKMSGHLASRPTIAQGRIHSERPH